MLTVIIPQKKPTPIPECKRPQQKLPKVIRQAVYKERERIKKCNYSLQELRTQEKSSHSAYIYSVMENFGNSTYWLIMREAFGQEADMIEKNGTTTDCENIYEKSRQRAIRMCVEREIRQQCCTESEEL